MILLTNDDGVDAPGLSALLAATEGLGAREVFAPLGPRSGCGHVVTTHAPIAVARLDDGRTSVDGSPADCVRVALHVLDVRPDWVCSGVNAGGNLGADIHHSGTVAAVREAAILGIPGIAISHYIARGRQVDWEVAAHRAASVIRTLMARPPGPGAFWNVNLPHPEPGGPEPEVVFCPADTSPMPVLYREEDGGLRYRGDYQTRPRHPSADVAVCFGGRVAVSLVRVLEST